MFLFVLNQKYAALVHRNYSRVRPAIVLLFGRIGIVDRKSHVNITAARQAVACPCATSASCCLICYVLCLWTKRALVLARFVALSSTQSARVIVTSATGPVQPWMSGNASKSLPPTMPVCIVITPPSANAGLLVPVPGSPDITPTSP